MAVLESLAVLAAKVASASTVAQATAGLGIVVVGVTGAGAAGILPGPLQDGVASAVETVSPFDLPDPADDRTVDAGETRDSGTDGPDDLPGADPTDIPSSTPSSTPSTQTPHSSEAGDDGGTHQNRGGAAAPTPAMRTDNSGPGSAHSGRDHAEDDGPSASSSSSASHSAEDEDEDHDEDRSGHGGGGDDSDDDSSGHGGGDDD